MKKDESLSSSEDLEYEEQVSTKHRKTVLQIAEEDKIYKLSGSR